MSGTDPAKPAWLMKQERKNEKAAKEAFEATFGNADEPENEDPEEDDDDDDEDDADNGQPLGPLCPARCSVSGKGLGGGQAGESLSITVTAKDDAGQRITWGGAKVAAELTGGASDSQVVATVKDCGNGEYIATFCVQEKGNYMLKVPGFF